MPATYTDCLPPTKSDPKGQTAFDWTPTEAEGPAAGVLTIKGKRAYVTYVVNEFPTGGDFDGRGFYLAKLDSGSDTSESNYSCFVARNGQDKLCECKGFAYHGTCKHISALMALIQAGKL